MSGKLTNGAVITQIALPVSGDLMYIVRPSDGAGGSHSIEIDDLEAFLLSGVSTRIFVDVTTRTNVLAVVLTVATVSIPAGTLAATGDFIEFVMEFDVAGPGNSKTITYSFGGQNLNAAPWNNTLSSTQGVQIGRVYRVTDTTCRAYISNTLPFLGQTTPFTQFGDITVADMDVNALNFVATIQGTASGDISHRVSHLFVNKA
jgi:hypothetical protein